MIYNLDQEFDRQQMAEKLKYHLDKRNKIELKQVREKRSYKQNAYLHLICGWFGIETGYDLNTVKEEFFKKINRDIFAVKVSGSLGNFDRWKSTAELDTLEMTQAIEKFRNYASNEGGIYLPAPNETEYLQKIEEDMKSYGTREYL